MALNPLFSPADALVAALQPGQVQTWTPQSLSLDPWSFHDHAQRILELAIDNVVEAMGTEREILDGKKLWSCIVFKKL